MLRRLLYKLLSTWKESSIACHQTASSSIPTRPSSTGAILELARTPEKHKTNTRLDAAAVDLLALLDAVGDGALAGGGGLGEGGAASEGPGGGSVADTHDADVVDTGDGGVARHALGHLDLDGEVGVGG
jgi:hypothetical protein